MTDLTLYVAGNGHKNDLCRSSTVIVSEYLNLNVVVQTCSKSSDTELLNSPFKNKLPALLISPNPNVIHGNGAILRALARLVPSQELQGKTLFEQSNVDSWIDNAFGVIDSAIMAIGKSGKDQSVYSSSFEAFLTSTLNSLNNHFTEQTFLCSNAKPTLADFALFSVLFNSTTTESEFSKFEFGKEPNLSSRPGFGRWVYHMANFPCILFVLPNQYLAPWGGRSVKPQSVGLQQDKNQIGRTLLDLIEKSQKQKIRHDKRSDGTSSQGTSSQGTITSDRNFHEQKQKNNESGLVWLQTSKEKIQLNPPIVQTKLDKILDESVNQSSGFVQIKTSLYAPSSELSSKNKVAQTENVFTVNSNGSIKQENQLKENQLKEIRAQVQRIERETKILKIRVDDVEKSCSS